MWPLPEAYGPYSTTKFDLASMVYVYSEDFMIDEIYSVMRQDSVRRNVAWFLPQERDFVMNPEVRTNRWERRSNFTGIHLNVGIGYWNPGSLFTTDENGAAGNLSGYSGDIVNAFRDHLGFDMELWPSPDNIWALDLGNGTWLGLAGYLQNREVDFLASMMRLEQC